MPTPQQLYAVGELVCAAAILGTLGVWTWRQRGWMRLVTVFALFGAGLILGMAVALLRSRLAG